MPERADLFLAHRDYSLLPGRREQTPQRRGHNVQDIRLTTKGAKLFAMRAKTKRGDEIAEFFVDALGSFFRLSPAFYVLCGPK